MKERLLPQNPNNSLVELTSSFSKGAAIGWLSCGAFRLPLGKRTLIMGILNVTPDSFSDGGRYLNPQRAVEQALSMEEQGADLIDIGGESTRPGAQRVLAQEEMRRVLPVIERLLPKLRIPISVDTSKASVAKKALEAGATLINDVSALSDPGMARLVASSGVPVILMHMWGTPRTMQREARHLHPIPEILHELNASIEKAHRSGISKSQILIDPGIGFGKGLQENLLLLKEIAAFKGLGVPLVLGPSRKSFIGQVLGETDPSKRLFGTAAVVAWAAIHQADMVRVHDVACMRQIVDMVGALERGSS